MLNVGYRWNISHIVQCFVRNILSSGAGHNNAVQMCKKWFHFNLGYSYLPTFKKFIILVSDYSHRLHERQNKAWNIYGYRNRFKLMTHTCLQDAENISFIQLHGTRSIGQVNKRNFNWHISNVLNRLKVNNLFCFSFSRFVVRGFQMLGQPKGIFSNSSKISLWHELHKQKSLFPKLLLIPCLRFSSYA